jgi:hypothetical protein
VEEHGRVRQATQMAIRRMRFECWLTKATVTVRNAFPRQQWSRQRASILHYTNTACPAAEKNDVMGLDHNSTGP